MSSFFDDPDAAIERVQRDIEAAQERAARASEVRASIDRVRGRARSRRNEVEVEVDATGQLTDLLLADSAMDLSAGDLARLIRETARAAIKEAGQRAVAVSNDAFGEDSAISTRLREEIEARQAAR